MTFLLSDGREEVSVERWVNKLALTWESIFRFIESATVHVEPLSKSEYSASMSPTNFFVCLMTFESTETCKTNTSSRITLHHLTLAFYMIKM